MSLSACLSDLPTLSRLIAGLQETDFDSLSVKLKECSESVHNLEKTVSFCPTESLVCLSVRLFVHPHLFALVPLPVLL